MRNGSSGQDGSYVSMARLETGASTRQISVKWTPEASNSGSNPNSGDCRREGDGLPQIEVTESSGPIEAKSATASVGCEKANYDEANGRAIESSMVDLWSRAPRDSASSPQIETSVRGAQTPCFVRRPETALEEKLRVIFSVGLESWDCQSLQRSAPGGKTNGEKDEGHGSVRTIHVRSRKGKGNATADLQAQKRKRGRSIGVRASRYHSNTHSKTR
ncbi:hypothetical protein EXIGLDRAFT_694350 [Exidia glandulosa HHB12029]|uniref:Uncharacterized protein n=1 Tax=Exidia glandulosa HHB12029 TaxID=1314781 RepID=A0A165NN28_EXIGL|nr:hypothetical protein EXIGLDRAFT_694350 [Exidia glandulosa HHB12029]